MPTAIPSIPSVVMTSVRGAAVSYVTPVPADAETEVAQRHNAAILLYCIAIAPIKPVGVRLSARRGPRQSARRAGPRDRKWQGSNFDAFLPQFLRLLYGCFAVDGFGFRLAVLHRPGGLNLKHLLMNDLSFDNQSQSFSRQCSEASSWDKSLTRDHSLKRTLCSQVAFV